MTVCDKRFEPPIYYICLDGQVHAVTVQKEWAQLIYQNYQDELSE